MKEQIIAYFRQNKEAMLSDLMDLIRINSQKSAALPGKPFGEGPAQALELALKKAESMGFKTVNYDHYVGTVDFNEEETQLDILVHLDVVPATEEWTVTKPFEPVIVNGRVYGRGSSDDKGPAIAALYAMKAIKELNIPLHKNVRLILGTDEECGGSDIDYYYQREKEAPMTFSPDANFPVINVEKGGLRGKITGRFEKSSDLPMILSIDGGDKLNTVPGNAIAKVKGLLLDEIKKHCAVVEKNTGIRFEVQMDGEVGVITAYGRSAHAANPEKGNNAITGLLNLLTIMPFAKSEGFSQLKAFYEYFPHGDWLGRHIGVSMYDEISKELTLSINLLTYHETAIEASFDCRAPLCANNENVRDVIKKKLKEINMELQDNGMYPPHHVDEKSEFVQTLLKSYEMYTGKRGECLSIGGGTYVHGIKNGVAFGGIMEGVDTNMHGINEFIPIEDFITSAAIFTEAIINLCQ